MSKRSRHLRVQGDEGHRLSSTKLLLRRTHLGEESTTLEEKGQLQRLRPFRRAEELGNVSQAWREAGLVRSLYDQLRGPFLAYGPIGLHPKAPPWAAGEATQPQRLDRAPDPGRGPGPAGLGTPTDLGSTGSAWDLRGAQ